MRAMCGVQLEDRKRAMVLMLVFGLNASCHLVVENAMLWYGHVMRREPSPFLSMSLEFAEDGLFTVTSDMEGAG